MRNKRIKTIIPAICLSTGLIGCTVVGPHSSDKNSRSAIEQALADGIKDNQNSHVKNNQDATTLANLVPALELPFSLASENKKLPNNETKFDVAVKNVPVRDFFLDLVKGTKYNIILEPQISGNISLTLKRVTIPQVIEAVHDLYGFEYEVTSYGYKIFERRLVTKVFQLNCLDIIRDGQSHTSIGSGQITNTVQNTVTNNGVSSKNSNNSTPSGVITTSVNARFWDSLQENLLALIGNKDGRSIAVNSRSGVVVVKAYPDEVKIISQYLDRMQDIMNRQVIIEAKVLEVELKAQFQSGINWRALGFTQGYANSTVGSVFMNNSDLLPSFNGVTNIEAHSRNAFNAVINLLNAQGEVNVLSSPRIATTNNQKAVIKVGTDQFFVTDVSNNTSSNYSASNTSSSVTLTPFFSGISLDVTPQIDEDNYVTVHIHPIVSQVEENMMKLKIDDKDQQLPLAKSSIRESDSIVRAKSGQVIVIGGLMETSDSSISNSMPIADQVPIADNLFKNQRKTGKKYELVILLRLVVTGGIDTWQKQLQQVANELKHEKNFGYSVKPRAVHKTAHNR